VGPPPEAIIPADAPDDGAPPLEATDVKTWLDGFIPYALQSGDVAGAVVAVVEDGEILVLEGYGYADVETRKTVDPERTLFRPGSVSKLFTWTAIMQLVEQGTLDLDEDVNAYLDFRIPPHEEKPVTLRNIMTHTAGFEEAFRGLITPDIGNVGLEKTLKRWIPERVYAPGSTPAYSNYATALAGYIVELVSGETFDDYIERHIFDPLEMRRSSFRQPLPDEFMKAMSSGYERASNPAEPYEYVSIAPAGSLAATGADMANFMIAHLQKGAFGEARILREETADAMHETTLTVLPPLNRMALGFYENNVNGHRVIAHGGDTYLFHSELNLFIDHGVGMFISVNSAGKEGAAYRIRTALLDQFADRYFPEQAKDEAESAVDPETAARHASMVQGTYDNSRRAHTSFMAALGLLGEIAVVDNGDGTITVDVFDDLAGVPKKWRETAPFVWTEVGGKDRLAAQVVDGKVVRFSVDELSPFMVFDRIKWWRNTSWLSPLFRASMVVFVLTVLLWPVRALVRRAYRVASPLSGTDLTAYRAVRIASVVMLACVAAWVGLVSAIFDHAIPSTALDVPVIGLQVLTLVATAGGLLIALCNARLTWGGMRGWCTRLWSGILVIAFGALLWIVIVFRLVNFSAQY
jgi:CubicO group peptidase (beta-lactamase class C family)